MADGVLDFIGGGAISRNSAGEQWLSCLSKVESSTKICTNSWRMLMKERSCRSWSQKLIMLVAGTIEDFFLLLLNDGSIASRLPFCSDANPFCSQVNRDEIGNPSHPRGKH